MIKADAWSVKGVGVEARAAAFEAARRAGLSVGDWLDKVIADRAAELGVDIDSIDAGERLEAVTAKLAHLPPSSERPRDSAKRKNDWGDLRTRSEELRDAAFQRHKRDRDAPESTGHGERERIDSQEDLRDSASRRQWRDRDESGFADLGTEAPAANKDASPQSPSRREWRDRDDTESAARRDSGRAARAADSLAASEAAAAAARLEAKLGKIQRTVDSRDEKTAQALASLADWMKQHETARSGERESADIITDRLGRLERHIAQRSGDKAYEPIKAALSRLEKRIDSVAKSTSEPQTRVLEDRLHDLSDRLTDLTDKIDRLEVNGSNSERADHFTRLEAKLGSILASLDRPPPAPARPAAESIDAMPVHAAMERRPRGTAPARPKAIAEPPASIQAAVAEIAQRQRDLDNDSGGADLPRRWSLRRPRPEAPPPAPTADFTEFDRRLEAIANRIERAADVAPRPEVPAPDFTEFDRRLEGIAERIERAADAAPRPVPPAVDFKEFDRRLEGIAERIERAADAAPKPALDFKDFDRRLEAIADRIERAADLAGAAKGDEGASGALETLQGEIGKLTTRLEELHRPGPHPDLLALRREIAEMSHALADLAPRGSVAALEGAVRELSSRVAASREDGVRESVLKPVEHLADDLRSALRDFDPRETIDTLDREIKAIGRKLEQMSEWGFDPEAFARVHDQTQEIRDLLSAAAQRPMPVEKMERQISALSDRLDEIATQGAGQRATGDIGASAQDIRALLKGALPLEPFTALETRVEALAAKIDDAFARPAPQESFDALSRGIERVQSALAQSTAFSDTRPLESLIQQLTGSIDRLRVPQAAPPALEGLETQIGKIATMLSGSAQTAPQVEKISREIVDLRTMQDEADHRTHATLTAVHQTLEKVVDRLSSLEEDVVDKRQSQRDEPPPPAPPPAPAPKRQEAEASAARSALERMLSRRDRGAAEPSPKAAARPAPVRPPVERVESAAAELPASDAPDFLIEPGSGFAPRRADGAAPDRSARPARQPDAAPAKDDAAQSSSQSSFIAAARRAAQAAAAEAAAASSPRAKPAAGVPASTNGEGRMASSLRAFFTQRKRPLLLGVAGLALVFGGYEMVRSFTGPRMGIEKPADTPPAPGDSSSLPLPPAETQTLAQAETPAAPAAEAPAPSVAAPAPPVATAKPPASRPPQAGFDPSPVGSIGPAPDTFAPRDPAVTKAPEPTPPAAAPTPPTAAVPAGALNPAAGTPTLRQAAMAGNAGAQYELGARLAEGRQMPRDLKASTEWFEKAAAQGLVPAQYRLGVSYEKGLGVAQDLPLAKAWYQRSASAGNAHAMHNLAVVFAEGAGGKPDYVQAAAWFRKAAEFGIRDSQYNLGILFARGLGIEQDLSQSYIWFSLAAVQGDQDAGKKRDEIAKRLDARTLDAANGQVAAFQMKPLDPAANEPPAPPGGWDPQPATKPAPKTVSTPKVSTL